MACVVLYAICSAFLGEQQTNEALSRNELRCICMAICVLEIASCFLDLCKPSNTGLPSDCLLAIGGNQG